jgi:hypothetical protein
VLLVCVARGADATLELNATALLDDVRGFVRRGVEIRLAFEADLAAACVSLGTELLAGFGGGATSARLDPGDIVSRTQRSLDRLAVGQRLCRTLCAAGGDVAGRWSWSHSGLRLLQLDALDGGPLADRSLVAQPTTARCSGFVAARLPTEAHRRLTCLRVDTQRAPKSYLSPLIVPPLHCSKFRAPAHVHKSRIDPTVPAWPCTEACAQQHEPFGDRIQVGTTRG